MVRFGSWAADAPGMADSATVVVAGPALLVENRSGVTRPTDGTDPRAWAFTTVRVLVESLGVTEVTLPDNMKAPVQGEDVAYVVEVRPRNGGLNCRAVRAAA